MKYAIAFLAALCLGFGLPQPIVSSSNHRYLQDASGQPFLMMGDSAHALIAMTTWADQNYYLANRRSNGVNTVLFQMIPGGYVNAHSDDSLLDGTKPFTGTLSGGAYDFLTLNEAYMTNVDRLINSIGTNGMVAFMCPLDYAGLYTNAIANGSNSCWRFGTNLGGRYVSVTNLMWHHGNDADTNGIAGIATNDICMKAIADGIAFRDTNHISTIELGSPQDSQCNTRWTNVITLNASYSYDPCYSRCLTGYNRGMTMPVYYDEGHYELQASDGFPARNQEAVTTLMIRKQFYWSLLSGANAGQLYGSTYFDFHSGWQAGINTPGITNLTYCQSFFTNRLWYSLVPDQSHALVTAGYGTYIGSSSLVGGGLVSTNNYVTAALTADGKYGVAYCPTNCTIMVDMSQMARATVVSWFDPTANTYTFQGAFPNAGTRTFSTPGNNSTGDADWLLLLEAVSTPTVIKGNTSINGKASD